MLEDALRDDRTDIDNESTADLVSQIGRGLRGVNLNAPSLATESMYGDEYNDQSDDYGGDSGEDSYDEMGDTTSVQLPSYPTPYEVWQAKHSTEDDIAMAKKLTKKEMKGVIHRLNQSGRKKQELLAQQQHKQIAEEIKNASFHPEINKKSRELNEQNHVQRLPDRQDALLAARDAQLKKQRELKVEKELGEMRDLPDVQNSHESWRRIKARMNIVAGNNRRTTSDLLQYGDDKKQRLMQRRQIAHETEDREATFTPQINQHSLRLHQRMTREGRDVRRDQPSRIGKKKVVVGGTGTAADPGHEEELFKPKINARSKAVPVDGAAHTRLYDRAMEKTRRKQDDEERLLDAHVKDVPGVGSTRKIGARETGTKLRATATKGSPGGGVEMDAVASILNASPGSLMASTEGAQFTVVDYDEKMDFIFGLFNQEFPPALASAYDEYDE